MYGDTSKLEGRDFVRGLFHITSGIKYILIFDLNNIYLGELYMNNLKKIVIAVAFAAPAAVLAAGGSYTTPASSSSDSSFYVQALGGLTTYKLGINKDAFNNVDELPTGQKITTTSDLASMGFAFGLNAGYNFYKGLGVELGGLYSLSQKVSKTEGAQTKLSSWNIHAALRVAANITDAAQVYAKGGMAYVKQTFKTDGESGSTKSSRIVPFFGLGGSYNFMKLSNGALGASLEWDHTASYAGTIDNSVLSSDSFLLGLNYSMSL